MAGEQLRRLFAEAKGQRALLMPYLTAGIPDVDSAVTMFTVMADAGADVFEVGLPYSDPLMDGPVIQRAGRTALRAGVSTEAGIRIAGRVGSETGCPVVVMTYANPVLSMGVERFAGELADAGIDAVIIADVPVEEAPPFRSALAASGIGLVLFVAPTTSEERLGAVAAADPVFVYAIARMGVTGERDRPSGHLGALVGRYRRHGSAPVVAGVGVSTPAQAAEAAAIADGVIVGSALVRRVLDAADSVAAAGAVHAAVRDLKEAVATGYRGRDSNPHGLAPSGF